MTPSLTASSLCRQHPLSAPSPQAEVTGTQDAGRAVGRPAALPAWAPCAGGKHGQTSCALGGLATHNSGQSPPCLERQLHTSPVRGHSPGPHHEAQPAGSLRLVSPQLPTHGRGTDRGRLPAQGADALDAIGPCVRRGKRSVPGHQDGGRSSAGAERGCVPCLARRRLPSPLGSRARLPSPGQVLCGSLTSCWKFPSAPRSQRSALRWK